MVYEEQMLRQLPHLQLGLCHDVYSFFDAASPLYVVTVGNGVGAFVGMGDPVPSASRAVFHSEQCLSFLCNLQGKAVPPQGAAETLSEKQ